MDRLRGVYSADYSASGRGEFSARDDVTKAVKETMLQCEVWIGLLVFSTAVTIVAGQCKRF